MRNCKRDRTGVGARKERERERPCIYFSHYVEYHGNGVEIRDEETVI